MGLRGPLPRSAKPAAPPAKPSAPLPAPSWLPPAAAAVWAEVEPGLRAAGRLRPETADTLANYCCTAAELRVLSAEIAENGSVYEGPHGRCPSAEHSAAVRLRSTLLSLAKSLGMTADSRLRLEAGKAPSDDPSRGVGEYAAARNRPRTDADADAAMPPGGRNVLDFVRAPRPPADPSPP